jgi:DNA invertase Pin-like site-specific DNA recombinase
LSRKQRIRLFLASDVLTAGIISARGLEKAVLSLCAARTCRLVLAEAVRDEVQENLLFRLGGPEDETARRGLRDFARLIAFLKPELLPRLGPTELKAARRRIPRAAGDPVLLSALASRPDWFLTYNTQHFPPAVARRTGLRFATPAEFFQALARSISFPGERNEPAEPDAVPAEARKSARNAAVYVRTSEEEEAAEPGVSSKAQVERARAYLRLAGLRLKGTAVDKGVSGAVPFGKRPDGAFLLDMIQGGEVRHVVALQLDSLFHSAAEAVHQMSEWHSAGVVLHVMDLSGQAVNTGSAMGRLMLTIGNTLMKLDRHRISEPTARALADKRQMGNVYGPTPYGYRRVGAEVSQSLRKRGEAETWSGERGTCLKEDRREREVVEQMRAARAEGATLQQIAGMLNEKEIPRKRGGLKWYPSTVKKILDNRKIHLRDERPGAPSGEER